MPKYLDTMYSNLGKLDFMASNTTVFGAPEDERSSAMSEKRPGPEPEPDRSKPNQHKPWVYRL